MIVQKTTEPNRHNMRDGSQNISGPLMIIGKSGQLGIDLARAFRFVDGVVCLGRGDMDLCDLGSIRSITRSIKPKVIINAAAYTAVDQAEDDVERARAINATAPAVLAEESKRVGALLIHYSTDYVFDGRKQRGYLEEDATNPLNVYGTSKREGEEAVSALAGRFLILRTSWVYAFHGNNFVRTILRLAAEREELRIVSDQVGVPNWTGALAASTFELVSLMMRPGVSPNSGTFHLSGDGATNWYEFAREVLNLADSFGYWRSSAP